MIPEFAKQGFNVVADNGDNATVFQKRLPAARLRPRHVHQHRLARSERDAAHALRQHPRPGEQQRRPELRRLVQRGGQRPHGRADPRSTRPPGSTSPTRSASSSSTTHVMLPLFQFPNIAAWRNDALDGRPPGGPRTTTASPTTSSGSPSTATRSSSAPSSGRTASTPSRTAPTPRGRSGRHVPALPGAVGHHRRRWYAPTALLTERAGRRRSADGHQDACTPAGQGGSRLALRSHPAVRRWRTDDVLRFTFRRLLWAVPALLIVTFLMFWPCRPARTRWPATCGQPAGHAGADPAVQGDERPHRLDAGAVLQLAGQLPHRRLGQLHQGQPAGVARAEGRPRQHARARHRSPSSSASRRLHHRHHLGPAAVLEVRHRRHRHAPSSASRSRRSSRRCCSSCCSPSPSRVARRRRTLPARRSASTRPATRASTRACGASTSSCPSPSSPSRSSPSTAASCGPRCSRPRTPTTCAPPGPRASASGRWSSSTPCATPSSRS